MDENNMNRKKNDNRIVYLIIIIIILVIGIVVIIFNAVNSKSNNAVNSKSNDKKYDQIAVDELSLGEEKYLEFLWMVDGAFNNVRYNNEDFTVNGRKAKKKPAFSCIYENDDKTCYSTNFEDNFHKLFASNVKLDIVYGDGASLRWYEKLEDKYSFTNNNGCEAGRMSLNQTLSVVNSTKEKIMYKVSYDEKLESGIFKGEHHFEKDFVLVYEDGTWKVSEAYYHNPCYMDYDIR